MIPLDAESQQWNWGYCEDDDDDFNLKNVYKAPGLVLRSLPASFQLMHPLTLLGVCISQMKKMGFKEVK